MAQSGNIYPVTLRERAMFYLYFFFIFIWPLALEEVLPSPYPVILCLLNSAIIGHAWYQCASDEVGYVAGLKWIMVSLAPGCIGFIFRLPIMASAIPCVILISVYYSIHGLFRGRQHSQQRWKSLVMRIVG